MKVPYPKMPPAPMLSDWFERMMDEVVYKSLKPKGKGRIFAPKNETHEDSKSDED